jgi:uncharacterized protein YlaN (UPF0358 family)
VSRVDIQELNQAQTTLVKEGLRIREKLVDVRRAMSGILGSDAMTGAVKVAIDLGIRNQHLQMLDGFHEAYLLLGRSQERAIRAWQNHMNERNHMGVIETEALREHRDIFDTNNQLKQDFDRDIRRIYRRIDHHLPELAMPSNINYETMFDRARGQVNSLYGLSQNFNHTDRSVDDLIDELEREVNRLRNVIEKDFMDTSRLRVAECTSFSETIVRLQSERIAEDQQRIEQLRATWDTSDPLTCFLNLPRPLDPEVLEEWLRHHGKTVRGLQRMLNGNGVNIPDIPDWLQIALDAGNSSLANVTTGITIAGAVASGDRNEIAIEVTSAGGGAIIGAPFAASTGPILIIPALLGWGYGHLVRAIANGPRRDACAETGIRFESIDVPRPSRPDFTD